MAARPQSGNRFASHAAGIPFLAGVVTAGIGAQEVSGNHLGFGFYVFWRGAESQQQCALVQIAKAKAEDHVGSAHGITGTHRAIVNLGLEVIGEQPSDWLTAAAGENPADFRKAPAFSRNEAIEPTTIG